ncbi:MAG: NHL repeat-containing protein [Bacteroidota bacterium]|nr:NHL repeat-containing protein [Bacteroidota bacterium]
MKFVYPKPLFNVLLLLFIAGITACKKQPIAINHNSGGTGNDSTTVVDTLPSFYSPTGVAVDAAGNIYVADYGNNLIRKITPAGVVSTLAGSGNQGQINAIGALASFNQPTGIAVDASGNVYVGDAGNNRIRLITPAGVVTTLAGSDSTGYTDGPGATAAFFHPEGVALDASGSVYVADAGNGLIRKVKPDGTVSTFAGNSVGTTAANIFSNPTGVAVDGSGNVFVANFINNNILKINAAGAVSAFAGSGVAGADNGQDTTATFSFPNSVAVDAANNLYVADGVNNLIRKITPGGLVSTLAGSGIAGSADSTGTKASFDGPSGLAVDAAGNVYVADSNNNLIRKITADGVVTTVAGSGESGARNGQAVARRNTKMLKAATKRKWPIFYRRVR